MDAESTATTEHHTRQDRSGTWHRRTNQSARVLVVLVSLAGIAGCANQRASSHPPAQQAGNAPVTARNYARESETVTLHLVRWSEAEKCKALGFGDRPAPAIFLREDITDRPEQRFLPIAEVAGALVGAVVDIVKAEIEKEAAKHEQQFSQSAYGDDFWTVDVKDEVEGAKTFRTTRLTPNYAGFELLRETADFREENAAFRLAVKFAPAQGDCRLVMMQPTQFRDYASAAKVSSTVRGRRTLTITVNTVVQSVAFDEKGGFALVSAPEASFALRGYDLNEAKLLTDPHLQGFQAGFFLAPQPTGVPTAPAHSDLAEGIFKLFVVVTEKDDSSAKTTILRFADIVGAQREPLIKAAKDAFTPPNP